MDLQIVNQENPIPSKQYLYIIDKKQETPLYFHYFMTLSFLASLQHKEENNKNLNTSIKQENIHNMYDVYSKSMSFKKIVNQLFFSIINLNN